MTLIMKPGIRLANDYTRPDDPDAVAYIAAVEAADTTAGQTGGLETATKMAINAFVKGCKADGIWPAIRASCILAGARTRQGALVPLVGTPPTPSNFVDADYNRKTGLKGDGLSKTLNSNRASNADPQNNHHASVYVASSGTLADRTYIGHAFAGGDLTEIIQFNSLGFDGIGFRSRSATERYVAGARMTTGFLGVSRQVSSSFISRLSSSSSTSTVVSNTPNSNSFYILSRGNQNFNDGSLSFYSIGESLDLALLDARVTTLINAIGAAF